MNAPMRRGLPEATSRITNLPRDHRGFPVPWFVQWFKDGKPSEPGEGEADFRVADTRKLARAVKEKRCWVCGQPLGKFYAFVIGPMCAINRVISEPPSHLDCAVFSAKGCPFLSQPRMKRNEVDLPTESTPAAGFGIKRNPGVVCIWVTKHYRPFRPHAGNSGILFSLGEPESVQWFAEGREATRDAVMASIDSGYPLLEEIAVKEGAASMTALASQRASAMRLLPQSR